MKKSKNFTNDLLIIAAAFTFCLIISILIKQNNQEAFYSEYKSGEIGSRLRSLKTAKNWASISPDSETRKTPEQHNDKPYLFDEYFGEIKEIYKVYEPRNRENTGNEDPPDLYKYMIDEMRKINGTRKILDIRSFQEYL